jgi:hypothetical protein
MDPTRQYGAASYTPVPDLDARLLAMRLGDPSSARQQARYPALTPLLLPKDLAPTAYALRAVASAPVAVRRKISCYQYLLLY